MQQHILLRRLLFLRSLKSSNTVRFFTRHANLAALNRPQLPFLALPLSRNLQYRYLTTARKRWLAFEFYTALRYTLFAWAIAFFALVAHWSVQQEWLERLYPTPPEWNFWTRMRHRLARWQPDRKDMVAPDWVQASNFIRDVVKRLEDPKIDGAGLEELTEGGVWIDGIGKSGYDVTGKSENWTRGYYEALMFAAQVAEHLDDHLLDTTRKVVFPANQVLGPSNPHPKPIPHGSPSAPNEDDCERAFDPPETFYMRILTTRGFTQKQKMDAALAYASWLDFKNIPEASERMYQWALSLATESSLPAPPPYDPQTFVLDPRKQPSANILTALTAIASHKARTEDVSNALPIYISILRARRSLLAPSDGLRYAEEPGRGNTSPWSPENIVGLLKRTISPPPYPAAPDNGEYPPVRDEKELCEEAALNLYIGEIMFASKGGSSGREDGLSWTRESVDISEEQLRRLGRESTNVDAKKTCKECLSTGLSNWAKMAARLAKEEREGQAKASSGSSSSSWLGLWGEGKAEQTDRWAAEELVLKERTKRAQEMLEELEAPKAGLGSLFNA